MSSHRTSVSRRFTWRATWLATSILFAGCSGFLRDPCADPREVGCPDTRDTGSVPFDMDSADLSPQANPRTFEWRAKVEVDLSTRKFVGMNGQMPVFHVKDGQSSDCSGDRYMSHWSVSRLDLVSPIRERRIIEGSTPPAFPVLPCMRFARTRVLVSNNTFYLVSSFDHSVRLLDTSSEVVPGRRFRDPMMYFRFPTSDGIAVHLQPITPSSSGVLLRWDAAKVSTFDSSESPATAIVMGDLDARDPVGNGTEALLFEQGTVQTVLHQGSNGNPQYTDEELRMGLDAAVQRIGKGQSVGAGFIADVDLDGRTDLVLAFGSSLYVTTYIGRDAAKVGKFRDWPKPIVALDGSEPIRSVMAVNLAQDEAPELVVETDKAVHFYLNNP